MRKGCEDLRKKCLAAMAGAAAVILVTAGAPGCASGAPSTKAPVTAPRPARINHLAFFKLRDPADADELIRDCDALGRIPGVVSYYTGKHLDVGRANVDGNYDVGFYVGFMTEEEYAAYVAHPDHTAMVVKWRPRWEWIRIHDVVDETP